MLLLLQLVVVLVVSSVHESSSRPSSNVPSVIELVPDTSFPSQHVLYGVPQLFRVVQLHPDTVYDIKVSYPATQPSMFTLQVEGVILPVPFKDHSTGGGGDTYGDAAQSVLKSQTIPPRHRVLNTAKLRLHPNEMQVHESIRYRLEPSNDAALEVEFSLLAQVEGVRRPTSKLEMDKCVFDIVVEEVLLEVFPRETMVLLGWLAVLLLVSGYWVLPYLEKKIALKCVEDRVEGTQTKNS